MKRWAWPTALLALCVALGALGVHQGLVWHRATHRAGQGIAVVMAAEREVRALISVSAATSARDLDQLRAGATGDFGSQLAQQSSTLTSALRRQKVTAQGTVVSAGLASLSDRQATVVVAATGTVTNAATAGPSSRSYRLRAELTRTGAGWLVSDLEFVS